MPKTEVWRIHYSTHAHHDNRYNGILKDEMFTTTGDKAAKEKVLQLVQRFVKSLRRRDLFIQVMAAPYINYNPNEDRNMIDGERMLRIRHGYANRRILRVINPDIALVRGYGSKQ